MKDTFMRRSSRLLFQWMSYPAPSIPIPESGAVIEDVTIINPCEGRQEHATVTVRGASIAGVCTAQPGEGSRRYSGCFVLPGLVDMHVHIPPHTRKLIHLLFLYYGVTAVREVGDVDGSSIAAREHVRMGKMPGPRIFTAGPVLDGDPPFLPTSWRIRTAEEARDAVNTLAAQGVNFIKVQHKLGAETLAAILKAAEEKGLYVAGHIPISTPFEQARIHDVQHLDGLVPYPQAGETPLDHLTKWMALTDSAIDRYGQVSREQGLVHTPTLVTTYAIPEAADPGKRLDPAVLRLPRHYRDGLWDRQFMPVFNRFTDEELRTMLAGACQSLTVAYRLFRAGVRLHLGTDSVGLPGLVPGACLQRELGLLVQAGLSIEEAWYAGTRAAGLTLGLPGMGTISAGAPADLLIFQRDPTRSLSALDSLTAVIAQGRLYTREFLEEALIRHKERFEKQPYDALTTGMVRMMLRSFKTR